MMLGMVLVLVLLRAAAEDSGYCADGKCFSAHANPASFDAANRACTGNGGRLMTVRTEQMNGVLSGLLENTTGDFWLGLRSADARCSGSTGQLKGYKWITGDDTTQYSNWDNTDPVCFHRCASVSKTTKWNERACREILEGYLCEYTITGYCHPLGTDASYDTSLGFKSGDLEQVPDGSNGTAGPLGTRHVCVSGSWIQAPWSCEVFGGGCAHECVETPQGHRCICPAGLTVDPNGVTCSPKNDPCERSGCAHDCSSSAAGFVCACLPGFRLRTDGKTCEDVDECVDESACAGANTRCVNTLGGFGCQCAEGFEDAGGGCVDVDECIMGPCEHECVNTVGGYNCTCLDGFRQSTEDMHRCKMHCPGFECPADCDPNNSAQCNCPDGFVLEDARCLDIDECDSGSCDEGHPCENTPGGFKCSCNEGFVLTDNGDCLPEFEGSGTSEPLDFWTPTSRPPPVKPASLSAGSLLGIMVCTVISILLLVCIAHCVRSKMHHYDVHQGLDEIYDFQQVIIDKNTHLSYPNRYLKRET